MTKTISLSTVVLLFLWNSFPFTAIAGEQKHDCKWEYSVENDIEKSKRCYLLVSGQKRVTVESKCRKQVNTEWKYGTCTHNIEIQPTKKTFTLNSGEDVVIVNTASTAWDTLLLGTISYGCCGSPHVVQFYTEQGKYMGKFFVDKLHNTGGNVITTIYDLENSAWDNENRGYFAVRAEDSDRYYVWFKEFKKEPVKLPISYSIPEKEKCSGWFLRAFGTYADRGLTMVQEARSCDTTNAQQQEFSCSKDGDKISCSPTIRRSVLQY